MGKKQTRPVLCENILFVQSCANVDQDILHSDMLSQHSKPAASSKVISVDYSDIGSPCTGTGPPGRSPTERTSDLTSFFVPFRNDQPPCQGPPEHHPAWLPSLFQMLLPALRAACPMLCGGSVHHHRCWWWCTDQLLQLLADARHQLYCAVESTPAMFAQQRGKLRTRSLAEVWLL